MSIRVLVVDDSRFFRRRVTEILETDPQIKVIDSAENGAEAVSKASRLKPDVITMDVEMPIMDGITATRKIMAAHPTTILMFSSLTTEGAKATFDALDAGAVDYLPKRFEDISTNKEEARRLLCEKVRTVGSRRVMRRPPPQTAAPVAATAPPLKAADNGEAGQARVSRARKATLATDKTKLVLIGTSTGGPVALQNVLSKLPESFPLPILLVQHMPGSFTTAFAQRLNSGCAIKVKEAADGDKLEPGMALLAPGGQQMVLEKVAGNYRIKITGSEPGQNYKPCVDITFGSVAKAMPGQALAIVLTGMGADGREGSRQLKASGSNVWAQDETSCVVYGMPAAVIDAGLADHVLALDDIGNALAGK
jgi:two-component system chemotaxis response regulator CheB